MEMEKFKKADGSSSKIIVFDYTHALPLQLSQMNSVIPFPDFPLILLKNYDDFDELYCYISRQLF